MGQVGPSSASDGSPSKPAVSAGSVATVTVALLFFSWLIDYIDRLVITLSLPAIGTEYNLSQTARGGIITAFFISYALFQFPGGLLADRFGSKKVMTFALTLWSCFTALTGAVSSYVILLVVRFFFGIFEGIFPGASMKAIAERTTRETRMTANGTMLASNPLGSALAPLVAAPVIALVGWRGAFFWIAGLGIIMAMILWFALPRALSESMQPGRAETGGKSGQNSLKQGLRLLKSGTMWKFTLMFFSFDIVSWGLISWAPSYLIVQQHVSLAITGVLASIPWFAATVSTFMGGVLFDRFFHDRHRWIIVPSMLITAVFLYLMLSSTSTQGFVMFESIGMFFMFLCFMPIYGLPLRLLPTGIVGSGSALVNFGGQAGGAVAPIVMGLLADHFGFAVAFGFLVLGAVLAAVFSLWSPQTQEGFERGLADFLPPAEHQMA